MPPQVVILDKTLESFQEVFDKNEGKLFGVIYDGKILILGCGFESPRLSEFSSSASSFSLSDCYSKPHHVYFPSGIDYCGKVLLIDNVSPMNDSCIDSIIIEKLKDVSVTNNPILLKKKLHKDEIEVYYLEGDLLIKTSFSKVSSYEFKDEFVFLHLLGHFSIPYKQIASQKELPELKDLSERIGHMIFHPTGTKEYINTINSLGSTIGMIFDKSTKKNKDFCSNMEVLSIEAIFPSSVTFEINDLNLTPYLIDFDTNSNHQDNGGATIVETNENLITEEIYIPIDGLCLVNRDKTLDEVHNLLTTCVQRNLLLSQAFLAKFLEIGTIGPQSLCSYHFLPDVLGHPVSYLINSVDLDTDLVDLRKGIHQMFNIPLERPYFTKPCSLKFKPIDSAPCPLLDVHIGLKASGIKSSSSKVALVHGHYHYYHYLMGGIKDSGWGCAYRSLQTIFSYFQLQGYTSAKVPDHTAMQDVLVKIGDKPSNFKGSNIWIGSTEVSFILESLLSVPSCILNVPSGFEMNTVGSALYEHFLSNGTPVMIGGGVLAHTIIGVDFDEDSGDLKFLILDPHYTGEDNLLTIQKKGFVGWKGLDFWDKKSFYNLCMPQRPIMF